jgi:hypothetical protein
LILIIDLTQDLPKKVQKKEWEFNQVFQDVWAIKLPWAEQSLVIMVR